MKRAGIAHKRAVAIYENHKALFVQAFTHKTANSENYDMLEAFGDKILNTALFDIMWEKYPQLDQGSITPAFQKAKSEEILSLVGQQQGFFDHVVMSSEYKADCVNWRDNRHKANFSPTHENENIYHKVLEDTVESFCGALCKAVNLYSECKMGPGAEVVYNWAVPIIDNLPFDPTDSSQTRNIKQQLKEFWDTVYVEDINNGNRIGNHMMFWIDKSKARPGRKVIHATDPDPKVRGRRKIIASTIGYNDANARLEAAKLAFPLVKKLYAEAYQRGIDYKNAMKEKNMEKS